MLSEFLFPILTAGASLLVSSAAGEFAKSAGKEAFDQLKALLAGKHEVKSLDLLERVEETPSLADAIKAELDASNASSDPDVKALADRVLATLEAFPEGAAAIDVGTIRSKGDQIYARVEGIKADEIISEDGSLSFTDIKAPKA